jgi:phosphatidylglycerol:prolipoprotein diacylglycerol transferase
MLAAPIPYAVTPTWTIPLPVLGDLTLGVFGLLVAAGVLVGIQFCLYYAKQRDLDEFMARDQMFWTLVFGFIISHWVSVVFYFPERMVENPWVLLMIWNGLSSVGGFFGAFIGMTWFVRRHKQPVMVYADTNIFGLVLGMIFGRLGCALVHDHPGRIVTADTFLAVGPWPCKCPEGRSLPSCCTVDNAVYRYDLGLNELLVLLVLGVFIYFVWDWRKAQPGKLTGLVATVYAVTRFWLDFLREESVGKGVSEPDVRYFGLTPAQYFTLAFFAVGVWLLFFRKPHPLDGTYAKDSERIAKERAEREADELRAAGKAP